MKTAQVIELCVETSVRKKYVPTTQPERPFHLDLKLQNHDKNYSEFLLMVTFIAAFFTFLENLIKSAVTRAMAKKANQVQLCVSIYRARK